jgi:hypothetical protein
MIKSFIKDAIINIEVGFLVILIFILFMLDIPPTNSSSDDNKDKFPVFGRPEDEVVEK